LIVYFRRCIFLCCMIPGARLRPPLRLLRVEVDDVAHDTGWVDAKMFLARHPHNEDADLTIRPESGSE
jgi:predicted component of type VI protein secretion system